MGFPGWLEHPVEGPIQLQRRQVQQSLLLAQQPLLLQVHHLENKVIQVQRGLCLHRRPPTPLASTHLSQTPPLDTNISTDLTLAFDPTDSLNLTSSFNPTDSFDPADSSFCPILLEGPPVSRLEFRQLIFFIVVGDGGCDVAAAVVGPVELVKAVLEIGLEGKSMSLWLLRRRGSRDRWRREGVIAFAYGLGVVAYCCEVEEVAFE